MSSKTTAALIASFLAVSLCGVLIAQEQDSLDALLEDISSSSPITGQTGMATGSGENPPADAAPMADELAAPAAAEPAAEAVVEEAAPAVAESAPAEVAVEEVAPTVAESAPAEVVVEEAVPAVTESAPAEAAVEETEPLFEESAPAEMAAGETAPAPAAEESSIDALLGDVAAPAAVEESPAEEPAMEAEAMAVAAPAEEAPEAAADAPKKLSKKEAAQAAQQEEVRRQAKEKEAKLALARGQVALKNGDDAAAIRELTVALNELPVRPVNQQAIAQAKADLAQAHYRYAVGMLAEENLAEARRNNDKAKELDPTLKYTKSLQKKIDAEEKRSAALRARPVPPKKRPEYLSRKKDIDQLLVEGKQFFDLGDFNSAEAIFEQVLLRDEYNISAMRFLRRLDEKRYEARSKERDATQADMIQKVRDAWNTPIREDVKLPEQILDRAQQDIEGPAQKLQKKMASIIIPSIEFRQANIHDVVDFLVQASQAGDPDGVGVNLLLKLEGQSTPAPAPSAAPAPAAGGFDEFGFPIEGAAAPASDASLFSGGSSSVPTITLNLRRISLLDAIKYITEVANLKFRVEENAVIIAPEGVASGKIITRLYPVQPSILDVIIEREETTADARQGEFIEMGSRTTMKKSDVKDFFVKAGVPFPTGTSITYNQSISQLIVANTPENLETFERILSRLNVVPNQVEIEARFVEIAQDDLEELGLEWILTDDYEVAQKTGGFGVAGQETIKINADANGVTKGLRFFNVDSITGSTSPESAVTRNTTTQTPLGGILTFASVLTNPELSVVLHALSQSGGADLLSAPRVTTRSGVNAQIQVVTEIIYPTEFEVTEPTISASTTVSTGGAVTGGGGLVTPPTVTPGSFETRETGVILNVTPTVGPDGYTIDLTLAPEVAELVDWIQYGSTISAGGQTFTYNIPQPVFSSRNVTTSIVIWDGQTVVMGGLIREDLVKVKDKVPLLGDIPFIGRLFRNEGESSRKKNLLIFVSARLVDPSGKPIHREEAGGGQTAGVAGGALATP